MLRNRSGPTRPPGEAGRSPPAVPRGTYRVPFRAERERLRVGAGGGRRTSPSSSRRTGRRSCPARAYTWPSRADRQVGDARRRATGPTTPTRPGRAVEPADGRSRWPRRRRRPAPTATAVVPAPVAVERPEVVAGRPVEPAQTADGPSNVSTSGVSSSTRTRIALVSLVVPVGSSSRYWCVDRERRARRPRGAGSSSTVPSAQSMTRVWASLVPGSAKNRSR